MFNLKFWGRKATQKATGEQTSDPAGYGVSSPKQVTEETALQVSAVWACVRLLSETVASLPLNVFQETADGRQISKDHPLYRLLHDKPNRYMTSVVFRETLMLNLCLHGNAYAEIQRTDSGRIVGLNPLPSRQVKTTLLKDGTQIYAYEQDRDVSVIAKENMLHIKLFGNGLIGLSPLAYARNAVGLALGAEEYGSKFYQNGGKPGGVLTIDKVLNEEQRKTIRKHFGSLNSGSENAHRLMILEAGMKYEQVQINPQDMQMLETRRFQTEEIARFFGVPGFLINDTSKTTSWGSGIEQMMLGFYQLNLRPYLTRWEQELQQTLLSVTEQRKYKIEFNFEGLLRGDTAGRSEYYSKTVGAPTMTINEARKRENLPPVTGGDELIAPLNMTKLEKLGENNA